MATFISKSPEETVRIGEQWGREAESGWVVGLTGDLGAGKTQLVKGIARGLGVTERVHSPTFAIINQYNGGRLPLFHLDLYRLETQEQIIAAGLEEYLCRPAGVTAIEWSERWFQKFPGSEFGVPSFRFRRVSIEVFSETERRMVYEDFGA